MAKQKPVAVDLGKEPPLDLGALPSPELERMLAAADEIEECYRVLAKGGGNIVSEVLKDQGTFYEWNHYPDGDVYDPETHAQYYYHAHRGESEHGHFHTFLREKGMPAGISPASHPNTDEWPGEDDVLTHFVAISMDPQGFPTRLFSANRWVTGETWYGAGDVCAMIDNFIIDHAYPSWPVNRWISALFILFKPEIAELLRRRDEVVAAWAAQHPAEDVLEDRDLDVTSFLDISVDDQIARIRAAAG